MKPSSFAVLPLAVAFLCACSDDPSLVSESEFLSSAALSPEYSSCAGTVCASSSSGAVENLSNAAESSSGGSSDGTSSSSSEEVCKTHFVGNSAVTINEIMPGNLDWKDDLGKDPGWVELYNASSEPVALDGFSLVEKTTRPRKWVFESDTIPANGYRIVFASKRNLAKPLDGTDSDSAHFRTHTNWKLEDDGGNVYLIGPDCGILDSASYPELPSGISWGKTLSGWLYFATPTPEADNAGSQGSKGLATVPVFGQGGGFYRDSVVLTPPQAEDGATVRCTFDGSSPTAGTEPMTATKILKSSTTVRCAAFQDGLITNKVATNTYFIDETVNMPVVAISVDSEFFDKHYMKVSCSEPKSCPAALYEDVEYPVHVEYFANGSNSSGKDWEIDAGISLMGNYSRMEDKKSVAIVMREDYQDGWLKYPLFETRKGTNSKFKAFNLRNNGNRFVSDYIEDAMGGAILEGSGVDYQRSRQVVVFYNGNYWGIHDMRERFNKNYVETNYGIDASTVNFIKHLGKSITASNGTVDDYKALLSFVAGSDFSGADNAAYKTVESLMDVGNYADYMAMEIYSHNGDWPNNNVRAWKSPEQKWKFMVYDLDHGYDWTWSVSGFGQSTNMFDWILQGGVSSGGCHNNPSEKCFHTFYVKLIKNPDFKRMFINRSAVMLDNYLNADKVTATVEAMTATLDASEMTRDLALFNRSNRYYSNSCGGGFSKSGSCLKTWAADRDGTVWNEYLEEFNLSGKIQVTIATTGNGYVKMEGMVLPNTSSYTGAFFGGNSMLLEAVPLGTGTFSSWEDGSTENPRLVTPSDGASFTAIFH